MMWLIFGVVALLITAGLIWNARRTQGKANLLGRAVPVTSVTIERCLPGEMVSMFGTARCDQQLSSQHQETPCIYYESSIIREYQKRRTSRRGGSSRGKETVHSFEQSVPFSLEDQSGRVQVIPEGAEFDARETMNEYVPEADRVGVFNLGSATFSIGNREQTLGHRYLERAIPVDQPVFVLGVVDEDRRIARPNEGRENAGFFISYRDEEGLKRHWENSARRQIYGAIILFGVGLFLLGYWALEHAPI